MDVTLIPGYYKHKYKFKVENVNDFVSKVRKAAICDKFFSYDDLGYAGISQLFTDFYRHVRVKLEDDPLLSKDINENIEEISEYVMFNLHAEFFYNQVQSKAEYAFQVKVEQMEKLEPAAFGIDMEEQSKHTWKSAIKEVSKIQEAQTPRGKLQALGAAIKIIEHTFDLYKEE